MIVCIVFLNGEPLQKQLLLKGYPLCMTGNEKIKMRAHFGNDIKEDVTYTTVKQTVPIYFKFQLRKTWLLIEKFIEFCRFNKPRFRN